MRSPVDMVGGSVDVAADFCHAELADMRQWWQAAGRLMPLGLYVGCHTDTAPVAVQHR